MARANIVNSRGGAGLLISRCLRLQSKSLENLFGHGGAIAPGEWERATQDHSHLGRKELLEPSTSAKQSSFDRWHPDLENSCRFLVAEALDFPKDKNGAERAGKFADGVLENSPDLLASDGGIRIFGL